MIFVIFFSQFLSATQVHIFGDSHGSFCFSNERTALPRDEHSYYQYICDGKSIQVEFNIHWVGSKTMFAIGRDGLNFINIKDFDVQENDVIIFVFGEIDARCHIGKQRDTKNRDLNEIIESLVINYLESIKKNKDQFTNLYCGIVSVMPPTNNVYNKFYPYYGPIEDRVLITRQLNMKLQELCALYEFNFLDVYSLYVNDNGFLDNERSDKLVHVNPKKNDLIKQKLLNQLNHKYKIFL